MFTNRLIKTVVVLLVLAVAFVSASFAVRSPTGAAALTDYSQIETVRLQRSLNLVAWDPSYKSIEQIRGSRSSAASTSSYDQVENIRALRTFAPADQSYNLVELVRNSRGLVADRSYDSIEAIRLLR
jgi:hypothetical protein